MVGGTLEARREHPTEEKVIVIMDCRFVLKLVEMKEGVGGSRVAVEGGHHKFSRKAKRDDFFRQW